MPIFLLGEKVETKSFAVLQQLATVYASATYHLDNFYMTLKIAKNVKSTFFAVTTPFSKITWSDFGMM